MNKDLIIESLEALVEKKEEAIKAISKDEEYAFEVWTEIMEGGKKIVDNLLIIEECTKNLSAKSKKRLQEYISIEIGEKD